MMSPDKLLLAAARRFKFCRRFGPAHEINWAMNLIEVAVAGLGHGHDHRTDLPKLPADKFSDETPEHYAAQLWKPKEQP